jgi:long-chain acyl-CoA synthetase
MASAMTYSRPAIALPTESCAAFVWHTAARHPEQLALAAGTDRITYGELARRVAIARARLTARGLGLNSRIGMVLPTSIDYVVQNLAALDLGAIVAPIYDSAPAAELRAKCLAARVEAVVVEALQLERRRGELAGLSLAPTLLSPELEGAVPDRPHKGCAPQADHLAFMPFSSGTTGEPKLILLSHRNVLASRLLFAQATGLTTQSVLVHFLPLSHVYGWMALTAALGAGATVILHARYDFDELVADIERHSATCVFAVSQTIIDLERAPADTVRRMQSMRWINTGSAPLAPSIMWAVADRYGFPVTTGYGLTEAAPVAHTPVERPDLIDVECVGYATADTELRLVDAEDPTRPAPDGSAGELVVRGPQVSLGYRLGDGSLDRSSWLSDGFFRTGDLVERDGFGRYRIVGRLKNIIKYKGYSVAPAELEALLGTHPGVRDCAVVGQPDPDAGEIPVAFIVPRQPGGLTDEEIISWVRARVAPQRRIRAVAFVEQIPRSSAGKMLTRELLNQV